MSETMAAWGTGRHDPKLMVTLPYDGEPASVGNGVMVALEASSRELVDAVYKKAMESGATDEGAPGPRGMSGFYAGYFRDPDGNKVNAFVPASLGSGGALRSANPE